MAGTDEPPSQLTLRAIMDLYKVPGLSVAVIDDYKVVWAKAGLELPKPADASRHAVDPFPGRIGQQAGRRGRGVRLVEEGRLSLNEDVNERLKAWKVAESEFTKDQKVTLRRVLSHTAGFTVHGFPGYAAGGPVPVLTQVLDGAEQAELASRPRELGSGFQMELLRRRLPGRPATDDRRDRRLASPT